MLLLTIDPSSTAIGYCISTGPGKLIEFGKITGKGEAMLRLEIHMLPDLLKIIETHKPDTALVETPAPQQGQRKATRGQATYGVAVGMVLRDLHHAGIETQRTRADQWTNGVAKVRRQDWIEQKYANIGYTRKGDSGGDISDAIGLSDWWWARQGVLNR